MYEHLKIAINKEYKEGQFNTKDTPFVGTHDSSVRPGSTVLDIAYEGKFSPWLPLNFLASKCSL